MKEGLTSFDIRALLKEMAILQGAHLSQIYQRESSFILRFNVPSAQKLELFVEPGRWLLLGEGFEKPREPPTLAQNLRKVLGNAILRIVDQRGFDRIVVMKFEREAEYTLILEMFGRGNLVLLRGGEVLLALRYGRWKTREIRRGRAYAFPPEVVDPTALDVSDFGGILAGYKGPVVKALASGLGLGGLYAEELCMRTGIRKREAAEGLGEGQVEALFKGLQELVHELEEPGPMVVFEDGPVDVVPFPLRLYSDHQTKGFASMSEALREYVESIEAEVPADSAVERYERRIARQEEVLRDLGEEIGRTEAAAEYLYAHYQEVSELLRAAREGELEEGVDPEKGLVKLATDDGELELDYHTGVEENARFFYKRKKASKEKASKVERAVEESRRELAKAADAAVRRERRRPSYSPQKKFWFDSYRWSLTSGRFLIIGGRDARSNEKLVKKHLEPGDRYAHADLTGAPSVVLKGGSKADEKDLRQACRLALDYSKAWRVGVGSGSAYWVTPEQVSKTAESGEYLRTGAFVIRGRRNYHHNIPLALGVGAVSYEGTERVIPGDPEAMEELSAKYVILEPAGPLNRRLLARKLSDAFRVPPEEIERILPTGSFHVRKVKGLRLEE